jgi:hypothetical protein
MDIYAHIDRVLSIVFRAFAEDRVFRTLDTSAARVVTFWQTDPMVAWGVSGAQIAAALLSAIFAFIIVIAHLHKKALTAAPATLPSEMISAEHPATSGHVPGALQQRWNEIRAHLDSPRESEWKVAVLEADKLVDDALARAGFSGGSFGDRLTNIAPGVLVSLDGLWWAHKIRNRLAHEMDYFLRYTEAKQAVAYYEQALNELQLI